MRRATVTAISLLAITLTVCAQARGETSEWEKFREWERDTKIVEKMTDQEPKPAICRNIEKHHPDRQEDIEYYCNKIPISRVYGNEKGNWFYTEDEQKIRGHYCRGFERELATAARDVAKGKQPNHKIITLKMAFCEQAFRIRMLFLWLRTKNK